jgi:hypothetical protein
MTAGHEDSSHTNVERKSKIHELLAVLVDAPHEEGDGHGYSLPMTPLRVYGPPPDTRIPLSRVNFDITRPYLPVQDRYRNLNVQMITFSRPFSSQKQWVTRRDENFKRARVITKGQSITTQLQFLSLLGDGEHHSVQCIADAAVVGHLLSPV